MASLAPIAFALVLVALLWAGLGGMVAYQQHRPHSALRGLIAVAALVVFVVSVVAGRSPDLTAAARGWGIVIVLATGVAGYVVGSSLARRGGQRQP